MFTLRKNVKAALTLLGAWTLAAFVITKLADRSTNSKF